MEAIENQRRNRKPLSVIAHKLIPTSKEKKDCDEEDELLDD